MCCAHGPMPVGETGGAKVRGGKAGGESPGLHKRLCARKLGDTGLSGISLALDRREGAAPPSQYADRSNAVLGKRSAQAAYAARGGRDQSRMAAT